MKPIANIPPVCTPSLLRRTGAAHDARSPRATFEHNLAIGFNGALYQQPKDFRNGCCLLVAPSQFEHVTETLTITIL